MPELSIAAITLLNRIAKEPGCELWETDCHETVDPAVRREVVSGGYVRIGGAGQNVWEIYRLTNKGRVAVGLPPRPSLLDKIIAMLRRATQSAGQPQR